MRSFSLLITRLSHLTVLRSSTSLFSTAAHVASHPSAPLPSPEEVDQELAKTGRWLRRSSQLDGRKRLNLSTSILPVVIPNHTIESNLMTIKALVRPVEAVGSVVTKWLGRMSRVPAIIDSLPDPKRRNKEGLLVHDQSLNIHIDVRDAETIVRKFGRNGCLARIIQVQLMETKAAGPGMQKKVVTSLRVKPQSVAVNASTQKIEHLGFIFCPTDRWLKVEVPIRLINVDSSVGLKKGGWHMICKRTVSLNCRGDSIPPFIELDVKNMPLDDRIVISDLVSLLPQGAKLCPQDLTATVVKCSSEVGDEVKRWGKLER